MFIDASALTAILAAEEGSADLIARLEAATIRMTSPLTVWETAVAIARVFALAVGEAAEIVDRYIGRVGIAVVPVAPETAAIALDAFARHGKGRRRLNFGDCFAYACARHLGQPLLFKGDDFTSTDVPAA